MRLIRLVVLTAGLCALAWAARAEVIETRAGPMRAEPVVTGLDTPWAFGFLPDGTVLITQRDGALLARLPDGTVAPISGVPEVAAVGQGGLLDVLVPRDFAVSREIFVTFARQQGRGQGTAVARAVLDLPSRALRDVAVIFEMAPGSAGGRHFGSRLVEAADGALFVTLGERGDAPAAQDLTRHNGKIVRIARDGTVPDGNPLAGQAGAQPEIWSWGHRNPQGAALDPGGQLWAVEHGAMGGDEVNRIEPGRNYGWPVIAYGRDYSGARIGIGTARDGLEQPAFYWDPSIAPSGMAFYDGAVAEWQGDLFIGSLKFDLIARLSGQPLREVERISGDSTQRVRDVRSGPDGALWFLSEGNGALYRLVPDR
ncbi:MAG: PQQ-dependent sugar dehydrogenase [Roseivivax sp.]|nr:PQQ-dependent sugar dehydrogenase [Roseivivax sp.]